MEQYLKEWKKTKTKLKKKPQKPQCLAFNKNLPGMQKSRKKNQSIKNNPGGDDKIGR